MEPCALLPELPNDDGYEPKVETEDGALFTGGEENVSDVVSKLSTVNLCKMVRR